MLHLALIAKAATVLLNSTPFEWASQHVHLVGWGSIVSAAAWIIKQVWAGSASAKELKDKAEKAVAQLDTLATNHFPHMEASLARQDMMMAQIVQSTASTAASLQTLITLQAKQVKE